MIAEGKKGQVIRAAERGRPAASAGGSDAGAAYKRDSKMPLIAYSRACCSPRHQLSLCAPPPSRRSAAHTEAFQRSSGQHLCRGFNYERRSASAPARTVPGRAGCSTAQRVVWLPEVVSVREGCGRVPNRLNRRTHEQKKKQNLHLGRGKWSL